MVERSLSMREVPGSIPGISRAFFQCVIVKQRAHFMVNPALVSSAFRRILCNILMKPKTPIPKPNIINANDCFRKLSGNVV